MSGPTIAELFADDSDESVGSWTRPSSANSAREGKTGASDEEEGAGDVDTGGDVEPSIAHNASGSQDLNKIASSARTTKSVGFALEEGEAAVPAADNEVKESEETSAPTPKRPYGSGRRQSTFLTMGDPVDLELALSAPSSKPDTPRRVRRRESASSTVSGPASAGAMHGGATRLTSASSAVVESPPEPSSATVAAVHAAMLEADRRDETLREQLPTFGEIELAEVIDRVMEKLGVFPGATSTDTEAAPPPPASAALDIKIKTQTHIISELGRRIAQFQSQISSLSTSLTQCEQRGRVLQDECERLRASGGINKGGGDMGYGFNADVEAGMEGGGEFDTNMRDRVLRQHQQLLLQKQRSGSAKSATRSFYRDSDDKIVIPSAPSETGHKRALLDEYAAEKEGMGGGSEDEDADLMGEGNNAVRSSPRSFRTYRV
ncbi:hypothetical protein HDV00_004564 [Rhizophlyctis rosea]|nr:hypothetical protein HDV00_004564 [Rhizophlyctis rosea]